MIFVTKGPLTMNTWTHTVGVTTKIYTILRDNCVTDNCENDEGKISREIVAYSLLRKRDKECQGCFEIT